MTAVERLLRERLAEAGVTGVTSVEAVSGGYAAVGGMARLDDGTSVFVKTLEDVSGHGVFVAEAEGLEALRANGLTTPDVVAATSGALVLSSLQPRPTDETFWEDVAVALAHLHTTTRTARHGWHRDNWLGRYPQRNDWRDDGFTFFAEQRLLRWLPEPRVQAKLDPADRAALERLCDRLPDLLPAQDAVLTHGDLWANNVLATEDGRPAVIDPAVSYTWPEVDLSHLWCTSPPPEARRFFDVYAELTHQDRGWPDRLPLVHLRQLLLLMAAFDDDWGSTATVRAVLAPYRQAA
jgi:fructosamine-3-kinase